MCPLLEQPYKSMVCIPNTRKKIIVEYLLTRCRHVIWYMKSEDVVEPNKGTSVSLKGIWIKTYKKLDVQLMLLAICLIRKLWRGSFCREGVQPVARRQHTLQGVSEHNSAQMCILKALEESFCSDFPNSHTALTHELCVDNTVLQRPKVRQSKLLESHALWNHWQSGINHSRSMC